LCAQAHRLFRSATLVFGPRLIGVVLTGYLDDGTAGLQAVKLCGGAAIVQDPKEAVAPGMPLSALENAHVDFCLPLAEIGPQLARMIAAPAPPHANGHPLEKVMQIGEASGLTCPDCHGALLRLRGSKPSRFRCHTGHAFTEQALLAGLAESTENMLWSAIRSLQEEAMLKRHLASHVRRDGAKAGELLKDAEEAIAAADRIRMIQENFMRRESRRE
jgi:two-component system chemotaxis response regulator CheB